jgi:serine/threonine protein kinase
MTETWKTWEGQTVDGFPLRKYLGGSDHSVVYLTELSNSSGQDAAIKFIAADASGDAQLGRWRVAGELAHPNVLQLIRVGRATLANTDFLYVVMDYAEEDLSQILPQRALEPEETRQILESVLEALTYLHGQGLVHTRIKPGNILAKGDQIKISSDTLCETGSAPLARPQANIYAAPESAAAPISPAADAWSLGVTIVEALTQRTPTIKGPARTELPLPETIPPPFLEIARRCVQLEPSRRASLKEISALLNPSTAPPREIPMALPVPEPVIAAEPVKKSLSAQQVSLLPRTLTSAMAQTRAQPSAPPKRKGHAGMIAVAVLLVLGAILLAPRMLNRFSQLQPQAATVQPSIAPASDVLSPPATKNSPTVKSESAKPVSAPQISDTTEARADSRREIAAAKEPANVSAKGNANRAADRAAAGSTKPIDAGQARGAVLYQVVPDVSQRARATITGKVRINVKLQVDNGGNVVNANVENDDASRYFADQAAQVSKRWLFTPPEVDGHAVASEWLLRFEFSQTATKVFPSQTNP